MGNVQDKLSNLGETISQTYGDVTKSFKAMVTGPNHPLPMPNLMDGRTSDELRTQAEMYYGIDTKTCINIAFLGMTNEAKISLINSCRYVNDSSPDACIASPKHEAVQYVHCDPGYKHLRFWDIADASGSFIERYLYAFDVVVLLTSEVIRESDIQLINQANRLNPPSCVLVVRTGMDRFVDAEFGLQSDSNAVIKGKNEMGPILKDAIKNQMAKGGVVCPCQLDSIHLVSAPGMLAARAVNLDGMKYVWDEFGFMKRILDQIAKKRY